MQLNGDALKNPEACANPGLIVGFLKASRKVSDDNVKNRLGQVNCGQVLAEVYKEWQDRDSVLSFCGKVSGSFSEAHIKVKDDSFDRPIAWLVEHSRDKIEFASTPTDPRVDAYLSAQENRKVVSGNSFNWINTEMMAESIIRESTLKAIKDRCGLDIPPYKPIS